MSKKSLLRMFRELRAAQVQHLILCFDIETEPVAKMVAQTTSSNELTATPVPAEQERSYIRVVLEEHVSYDHARKLKEYLISGFENIERVVLTMKSQNFSEHVYPELKIYTVRKKKLDAYKQFPSLFRVLNGTKTA